MPRVSDTIAPKATGEQVRPQRGGIQTGELRLKDEALHPIRAEYRPAYGLINQLSGRGASSCRA